MITWYTTVTDAKHNHGEGSRDQDMSTNDSDYVVTDEAIAKVMALGFNHPQAVDAIIKAKGDVGEASMMLSCDQVIWYHND